MKIRRGDKSPAIFKIVLFSFISLTFIISFFNILGVSGDWWEYQTFFDNTRFFGNYYLLDSRFEFLFKKMSLLLTSLFSNNSLVYSTFVFISILIKTSAINKTKNLLILLLLLLFYGSRFFPLHELTQIRAAIAIAFLFLSFYFSVNNKMRLSVLCALIAPFFHLSSIVFIPFVVINFNVKFFIILSASMLLFSFLVSDILIDFFAQKIPMLELYRLNNFMGSAKVLSVMALPDIITIIGGIYFWKKLNKIAKKSLVIQIWSFVIYYSFLDFLVVAARLKELGSVFILFYFQETICKKNLLGLFSTFILLVNICFYTYVYFFSGFALLR